MKKDVSDSQLNKFGLLKIFSSMDTQSAVVAAVVISVLTFLSAGFIELCNYVYWSAYFTKFRIPLAYMEEAIIHENGIKYIAVLCIPVILLVWLLLTAIKYGILAFFDARKKKTSKPGKQRRGRRFPLREFVSVLVLFGFILLHDLEASWIVFALYTELAVFLLWSYCKSLVKDKSGINKLGYYTIRVVGVLVMLYLILGSLYFAGSFENYSRNGAQSMQLLNAEDVNYYAMEQDQKVDAQLVLLETADYYYVTDVVVVRNSNGLFVQIWNDDTYRFVDKIDRPVKSIFAWLSYIEGGYDEDNISKLFDVYVIVTAVCVVAFVVLLSIPKAKEDEPDTEE